MQHHFSIDIAQTYGVNEAIFLENIAYWIWHNKANDKHFYEDRYWTYNSQKAFENLFPYWSRQNLRTIIKSCLNQNLIIKGNFNKSNYDHTQWYSLTEEGLKLFNKISDGGCNQPVDMNKSTNRSDCGFQGENDLAALDKSEWLEPTHQVVGSHQPIPYINTDNKQKIKDKAQPKKQVAVGSDPIVLPDWLDKELWGEFIQHRKSLKSPMSDLAQRKAFKVLDDIKRKGQSIEEVINNSIVNGWKGLFSVKSNKEFGNGKEPAFDVGAVLRRAIEASEERARLERVQENIW